MENEPGKSNKKEMSSLEQCNIQDAKGQEDFVGIKYHDGKFNIIFPIGYNCTCKDNKEHERKDILNLIYCLSKYSNSTNAEFVEHQNVLDEEVDFPIHAYLNIITYFLNYGYYKEKNVLYKESNSGKINWNRTIKFIKPEIINENIVYLKQIRQNYLNKENELITLIHKYCVYESFTKIGCLFTDFIPQKPELKFNKELFSSVIKVKISQTFNEKNLQLFNNMYAIVNYLGKKNNLENYKFGTYKFSYVWECMIDSKYGINFDNSTENKYDYYPHTKWNLKQNGEIETSTLRPDTIMISDKSKTKIYILDAKYYKYSETKNTNSLPTGESVIKQLAYAEFAKKKNPSSKIYNAFIMPYQNTDNKLQNIGYATSDFVDEDDISAYPYKHIQGILLDIKTLMFNHDYADNGAISELASCIEKEQK